MTIKTRTLVALLLSSAFTITAKAQDTNATTGTLGNSQIRFDESAPQRIMIGDAVVVLSVGRCSESS